MTWQAQPPSSKHRMVLASQNQQKSISHMGYAFGGHVYNQPQQEVLNLWVYNFRSHGLEMAFTIHRTV